MENEIEEKGPFPFAELGAGAAFLVVAGAPALAAFGATAWDWGTFIAMALGGAYLLWFYFVWNKKK